MRAKKSKAIIWLLLLALVFTLAGCGKSKATILEEFPSMLAGDLSVDALKETAVYLDEYISKLPATQAGEMLVLYEDYLVRFINTGADKTLVQQLAGVYDKKKHEIDTDKLKIQELTELYEALLTAHIHIDVSETDEVVLSVDYQSLSEMHKKDIPKALYSLYLLKAREQEAPSIQDASLLISIPELLERTYEVEKLIETYKENEVIAEDAKWMYTTYMSTLLMGTNHSPVFDYKSMEFSKEAKAALLAFTEQNPKSTTAYVLSEYFDYLIQIEYRLNYKDSTESKAFFDTCEWLVKEAEERVYQ